MMEMVSTSRELPWQVNSGVYFPKNFIPGKTRNTVNLEMCVLFL